MLWCLLQIAKIVGARAGVPVFGVSAPGIAISHRIFDVPSEAVGRGEMNLFNTEDMVPLFDAVQGG